jgi:GxGYxYP putative glycoside hydrolase C-terminal domain/GxGYxY sequence motif in domain of unknown function N-terminal
MNVWGFNAHCSFRRLGLQMNIRRAKKITSHLLLSLCVFFTFESATKLDGQASSPAPPASITPAAPAIPVVHFDLSDLRSKVNLSSPKMLHQFYDEVLLVTSLQGLVNRDGPQLIVRYNPELDDFWWRLLKQPGNWMEHSQDQTIATVDELLKKFRSVFNGVVVYDESVPATSNVAVAVAGADNLLVVRYDPDPDSFFTKLTTGPDAFPIKVRLIDEDGTPLFTGKGMIPGTTLASTGSRKNDAYRWLIENYLKTGKLDPTEVGYMIDAYWLVSAAKMGDRDSHWLNNLDYFIAKKEMPFDLDFASNEVPVDDPDQAVGTDFQTICLILKTCNELNHNGKIIELHGFVPFSRKYSNFSANGYSAGGKLDPVGTEWRLDQVISAFNVVMEVDGNNFPNSSFTRHYQLTGPVPQYSQDPTKEKLISDGVLNPDGTIPNVTFYAHYAGDYDSAAWIYTFMPKIWVDPKRGQLPVSWAINPNLDCMVAPYMYWIRSTAKGKDDFVAGDSGAGYINPYQLSEPREFSGLPSGVDVWESYNRDAMKRWGLDVIGFVIDGNTPFMKKDALDAYARVAPGGIGTQVPPPEPVHNGMPMISIPIYVPPNDGNSTMTASAAAVKQILATSTTHFVIIRSILWKPFDFVELEHRLDALGTVPRKLVDLRTLLWLQRYKAESH